MRIPKANPEKIVRIATLAILSFTICWGLVLVLFQVRPFWVDEWRLIYNLKFKDPAALWGPLDFTQQFPRVYLELLKALTSWFDYSYFILRAPSFLVGVATIFLCYHLMNKIYRPGTFTRFLFVCILISSYTFTEYFVQTKQYVMELFLCLVAIWQLLELLEIGNSGLLKRWRYLLLCVSFILAPFFSYTYPIAVCPVFMVVFVQGIHLWRRKDLPAPGLSTLALQWIPLALSAASIIVFYVIDVSHVMADREMHGYWKYRMMSGDSGVLSSLAKFWDFFAHIGAGIAFEIIFGVLGICAFFFATYKWIRGLREPTDTIDKSLRLYSILLVLTVIILFLAGKLPVEHKFNEFATPSVSILIIYFLDHLYSRQSYRKFVGVLSTLLFISLIGNIITAAYNHFTTADYLLRMNIYRATESAVLQAQDKKLPIFVTPAVALPDVINVNIENLKPITSSAVLKTFPAYKTSANIQVYSIPEMDSLREYMKELPPEVTSVMAGDGLSYHIVTR